MRKPWGNRDYALRDFSQIHVDSPSQLHLDEAAACLANVKQMPDDVVEQQQQQQQHARKRARSPGRHTSESDQESSQQHASKLCRLRGRHASDSDTQGSEAEASSGRSDSASSRPSTSRATSARRCAQQQRELASETEEDEAPAPKHARHRSASQLAAQLPRKQPRVALFEPFDQPAAPQPADEAPAALGAAAAGPAHGLA